MVIDVGCQGIKPWPLDDENPPNEVFFSSMEYSLEVGDQASDGKSVRMKLRMGNVSDEPANFVTGCWPQHDFVISTPDGA